MIKTPVPDSQHQGFADALLGVGCLLAVLILPVFSVAVADEAGVEPAASAISNQLANGVSEKLAVAVSSLKQLARDPSTISQFKQEDTEALTAAAESATGRIEHALKLRYFLPGKYRLDRDSQPPLGYASMDLLKQAEKSENPIDAELLSLGAEDEHIVLVARVSDEDRLLGLIHLSLDSGPFKFLPDVPLEGGYAELVQVLGSRTLVLAEAGDALQKQAAPVQEKINNSRWEIHYWPYVHPPTSILDKLMANELVSRYLPNKMALLAAGGGVLFLLLLLVLLSMRKKGAAATATKTEKDNKGVVYDGAVKAIMDGKHPGMEKLVPDLPRMGQTSTVKPVSQGMSSEEADDITELPDEQDVAKAAAAMAADTSAPVGGADRDSLEIPGDIFRAYDIRGVVTEQLTPDVVYLIGRAIGSIASVKGQKKLAVGRDGRISSPALAHELTKGLCESGCDVIDIGEVPTPLLYFATHYLHTGSGVMITGSHNGPEYNGLKIMLGGDTLSGDMIQEIRHRVDSRDFEKGNGTVETRDIAPDYIRRATEDVAVALGGGFKIVVDCGNGVAGLIAPQLYRAMGHDVIELYCEVDGKFPNHHPDPSQPENLRALISEVKESGADLGFAFDGDGDRLGVVDSKGNIIWPDRQLMLFAKDVLRRNKGKPVIYDVKCSRFLKAIIEMSGGEPLMWKTGHSLIKNKMKEVDAPLAGEMSGHIFFKERWYGFDDALYSGVRMLEILTNSEGKPDEVFAELPESYSTPELRIPLAEKHHEKFMIMLKKKMDFDNAEITDIDGLRVDFPEGWGLIRPSNTSPCLVARFEANDEASLKKIKLQFSTLISKIAPDLKLPF